MKKQGGFSLVELLVVIAVTAVLVAMLLPSLVKAKEAARRVVCSSNMKTWGLAQEMYGNDNVTEYMGSHMWDLQLNYTNTQRNLAGPTANDNYWTESWSVMYMPRYGIKKAVRRCPSRTMPRTSGTELGINAGSIQALDTQTKATFVFGSSDSTYWANTDYFNFWGRGTFTAAVPFGYVYWYRWHWIKQTTLTKGWGPVPNLKCNRRPDTPMMMDRSWTSATKGTSATTRTYYDYGPADEWGSSHLRRGNNPNRYADGSNYLRLDGSCSWVDLNGTTVNYLQDYYQGAPIPASW